MALVLIRMRLAALRHTLHGRRAFLFALTALYGLGVGIGSLFLPLAGHDLEARTDVVAALAAVWTLGWVVGSVLAGGGDETLRPENFALLPVTPRALARALLLASLVGIAPVATVLGLAGIVTVGVTAGALPALVAVIGLVLEVGFVIVGSRVVIAGLAAVLTSRRGKDLGVVLVPVVSLSYVPLQYLFKAIGPVISQRRSPALSTVLRALPSGWAADAVRSSARGQWLTTLGALLGLLAVTAGLLLLWAPLLRRRMTTGAVTAGPRSRASRERRRGVRDLGPVGAVVVRELRMWWRDARRRAALLSAVAISLVLPVFSFAGKTHSAVPYVALFLIPFAASGVSNLYGLDGASIRHLLLTPQAVRADVRGRQLAWLAVVAPLGILAAVLAPWAMHAPSASPWLAGLVPVLLGSGCGLVVAQSAFLPFPVPQQRNQNPFAAGRSPSGAGCARSLTSVGYLAVLAVTTLPVIATIVLARTTGHPVLQWLGAPVGVAVGAGLAWWWGRLAQGRVEHRGPEILAAVSEGT